MVQLVCRCAGCTLVGRFEACYHAFMNILVLREWQSKLFSEKPQRLALAGIQAPEGSRVLRIGVHRNHAFEPVAALLTAYLAHAGLKAEYLYSDYDDALSFAGAGTADIELLWLDANRYDLDDTALFAWLQTRVDALAKVSGASVVLTTLPERPDFNALLTGWDKAGVVVVDLASELAAVNQLFDDARATIMGTRLTAPAQAVAARLLGSSLPALVWASYKAVAIDLDHTLYNGVLGEDGVDGVKLEEGHIALQKTLVELHDRGVLLAIVSRNEPEDVQALFAKRTDFPLKHHHIANWQVSWGAKADAIKAAAKAFNIAPDAFVFIDDNPGELSAVAAALPDIGFVYSGESPQQSALAMRYFPRLWPLKVSETDLKRVADIRTREQRASMAAEAADPMEYLASLAILMTFARNPEDQRQRLADMSRKTNQFNLSLARFDEATVVHYLEHPARDAFTVALQDKLSDSGVIASMFTRTEGNVVHVDELCISCRALGRQLENVMISEMLLALGKEVDTCVFHSVKGERNDPARSWLIRYAGLLDGTEVADLPDEMTVQLERSKLEAMVNAVPVECKWRENNDVNA